MYRLMVMLTAMVVCGNSLKLQDSKARDSSVIETEVLVLGAGSAGIGAAKELDAEGVDFIILEATNRAGGRVMDTKLNGKTVEVGANWLHEIDYNPLWKYALKYRLDGKIDYYDDFIFKQSGGADITRQAQRLISKYQYAADSLVGVYRRYGDKSISMNMCEALNLAGWPTPSTRLEQTVEFYMLEWTEVLPCSEISFYGYIQGYLLLSGENKRQDQNEKAEVRDYLVADQRGYAFLLRSIASEFLRINDPRLRFNQVVTSIDYRRLDTRKVLVTTEGGQVYAADHVIVTFSNNVITYGDVQFLPALPDWKLTALRLMPTATYTKHFIELSAPVIDRNAYLVMVHNGVDQDWRYNTAWQNLAIFPQFSGTNIALVSNLASQGVNSALLNSTQAIDFIVNSGADVYPNLAKLDKTRMAETHRDWVNDRFARGAYAVPKFGLDPQKAADLKASVNGVIHFAGDGSNVAYYGTVDSAFSNGQDVAAKVAATYGRKRSQK